MFLNYSDLREQRSQRHHELLKEAEHNRLIDQLRKQSNQSSFRQQLGFRLVQLGLRLQAEPEASLA